MKLVLKQQNEQLPSTTSINKTEVKQGSQVEFYNFGWYSVMKDQEITFGKEGVDQMVFVDLTFLFGEKEVSKIQAYFFEFEANQNEEKHLILVGNNKILLYDAVSSKNNCKLTLNEGYKFNSKLKFDTVQFLERNKTLYILTDRLDLISLDLSDIDSEFICKSLQRKKKLFWSIFQGNQEEYYQQNALFKFYVMKGKVIIVQQQSQDNIRVFYCDLKNYCLLRVIDQNIKYEQCNLNISNFNFQEKENLYLKLIVASQMQKTKLSIELLTLQLLINFSNDQFEDIIQESKLEIQSFEEFTNQKIQSKIFIHNQKLHLFYQFNKTNHFIQNATDQQQKTFFFDGKIQGVGIQNDQVQGTSLKVCSDGFIYVLGERLDQPNNIIINHFEDRCNQDIIYNLLTEGYNQFISQQHIKNTNFLKLDLLNYSEEHVCQVINQILWDFMENTFYQYQSVDIQINDRLSNLKEWQKYVTNIVNNKSIQLNLIKSEICLRIGLYIYNNQKELNNLIINSLKTWQFNLQFELQFYSKLDDIETIIQELIDLNQNQQHLVNILTLIYQNINIQKKKKNLMNAKFWVHQKQWLILMSSALQQLNQYQEISLQELFQEFINDLSQIYQIELKFSEESILLFHYFTKNIDENIFQEIIIQHNLFELLYICYLRETQSFDKVFQIISYNEEQCQIFINLMVEHVKLQTNGKNINQIFEDIEKFNCINQVAQCLEIYPKLKNMLLIKTKRPNQLKQVLLQQADPYSKYYRFLVDTSEYLVKQNSNYQIRERIEIE